jgi:predicted nucleotidyltransferase
MADERELSPFARLVGALQAEKIRFQLIGMSAAILQGANGSTSDIDLWIDLPPRQYMKVLRAAISTGAEVIRNTVVALSDHTLVNFVYEVTGLGRFSTEFRKARTFEFNGIEMHVLPLESIRQSILPLESIRQSKQAIGRPKDLQHLQQINELLRVKREMR